MGEAQAGTAPQRPAFPYHEKLCLSIKRHIPPEPHGCGYQREAGPQEADRHQIIKFAHHDWVLQRPVAETSPHEDQAIRNLHIIDGIACEDGRGPQIVRCRLDENTETCVAKIYDALYYPFSNSFGWPVDVTWKADYDYGREAAAYQELKRRGVDGKFAPEYLGSWTFETTLHGLARPVRLILMEWIRGVSMLDLLDQGDLSLITPETRLEMFAQALEAECKIAWHNVLHNDLAPRNIVFISYETKAQTFKRVILIDFNQSVVVSRESSKSRRQMTPLPISPRCRYWGACPYELEAWVPDPHRLDEKAFKEWLKTRWENTGEFFAT